MKLGPTLFVLAALSAPAPAQVVDAQPIEAPDGWWWVDALKIGYAMERSGDTLFVSGHSVDGGVGAVICMRRDPASGAWLHDQTLEPSASKAQMYFGLALDLDGDVAVVGAPYETHHQEHFAGTAYVFLRDPATGRWDQHQKLKASNYAKDDYFGYAVALAGETIVAAAPLAGTTKNGILYVFERDPSSGKWVEQQQLTASLPGAWPVLGMNLSLDGDLLAAGNSGFATVEVTPAVVFRRPGAGAPFAFEAELGVGDQPFEFPIDVSVHGDRVLVGSREQKDGLGREGRAYLYEHDGAQWQLAEEFFPLDTVTEHFGFTVDLDDHVAAIGNYYHEEPTTQDGPAHQVLFEDPATGTWAMEALGTPVPAGTDWLGSVVLATGDTVFAHRGFNAHFDPTTEIRAHGLATARVGVASCEPPVKNSANRRARLVGRGSADVEANALVAEATGLPPNVNGLLLVSGAEQPGVVPPGSQGLLCLGAPIGRYAKLAQNSGAEGRSRVPVDVDAIPQPGGAVAALAGETWRFQFWYRDVNPTPTSNLSEVCSVTFR